MTEPPDGAAPEPDGAAADTATVNDRRRGPSAPPRVDRVLGGRYRRGREIGAGGMGRVSEAADLVLGRTVAIKEVSGADDDLIRRFDREVLVTARLEHPAIVPVYDAGRTETGLPFYVMRRVSGRPLAELVAGAADLDARLALVPHLLAAVDAVAHAHARGVLHRDLKPANVLVGDHGETLVIDWGLAKLVGDDDPAPAAPEPLPADSMRTRYGTVIGTPGFMAPEQALGEDVDARGDVYALGATLYHLLAGAPPWSGLPATEILDRVVTQPPPLVPAAAVGAPPELVAIVDKAMARDREARYPDAGALGDDLRRFLRGQLVAAHRYSRRERLARWLRANRAAVGVGAAAVAALAVISLASVTRIVADRDRISRARAAALAGEAAAVAARDLAQDRADEFVVENARAALDRDPTYALARLATLPAASRRWPAARAVAIAARARGVAVAYPGLGELVWRLVMSPDGTRVAVVGRGATIHVDDLVHRTTTAVTTDRAPPAAAWLGDRLALLGATGVDLVDLATGVTARVATPAAPSALSGDADGTCLGWVAGGQAFVGTAAATVAIAADGAPIDRVLVSRGCGTVLVRDARAIRVLVGPGTYRVAVRVAGAGLGALAPDGTRAAMLDGRALREWRLAEPGAAPRSWPVGDMVHPDYVGDRLVALDLTHHTLTEYGPGAPAILPVTLSEAPLVGAPIDRDGGLAVAEDGVLSLLDRYRVVRVRMPEQGHHVAARGGPWVVVATSAHVLAYDLREVWPGSPEWGPYLSLRAMSPTELGAIATDRVRLHAPDGATRDLHEVLDRYRIDQDLGVVTEIDPDDTVHLIDVRGDHTKFHVPKVASAAAYGPGAVAVVTGDHELQILTRSGAAPRTVAKLAAGLDWVITRAPYLAVIGADAVWRGDDLGGASSPLPAATTAAMFGGDGTLYLGAATELWAWPRGVAAPAVRARLPVEIDRIAGFAPPQRLAVIGVDQALYVVDLATGDTTQALPGGASHPALAPDGASAATIGDDRRVHVVDLTTDRGFSLPTEGSGVMAAIPAAGAGYVLTLGPLNRTLRYPIDLPRDPGELLRWIAARTNGSAGDGLLEWQLPAARPLR